MSDSKSGDEQDADRQSECKEDAESETGWREQGTVRQNMSHGRSKQVVVETKKRKITMPGDKPSSAGTRAEGRPAANAAPAPLRLQLKRSARRRRRSQIARHGAQRTVRRRDGRAPPRARRVLRRARSRIVSAPPMKPSAAPPRTSAARRNVKNPRAARPTRKRDPGRGRSRAARRGRGRAALPPPTPCRLMKMKDHRPHRGARRLRCRRAASRFPRPRARQRPRAKPTAAAAS
jgi:translation initiation factor IF-2